MTEIMINNEDMKHYVPLASEDQKALVLADRNRWFIACMISFIIIIFLIMSTVFFSYKSANNTELVYIKFYNDGHWQVETTLEDGERPILQASVDKHFHDYLRVRYGLQPETVRRDYAEAIAFMSNELMDKFISKNGFDAFNKVKKIESNVESATVTKIKFLYADHYDVVSGTVDSGRDEIYRTNLNFLRITEDKSEKLLLKIQWRLIPMKKLKEKDKDWLLVNPLGIEIISKELLKGPEV